MNIRNIVFDFDGTIADSMDTILGIVNDNHQKYGFEKLSDKKIRFLMGKGAKYLIGYLNIPKYKVPFLMNVIKTKLGKVTKDLTPFPVMKEVLKELNESGFTLGILTTNSKANVEIFLKKNKISYFNFIYHGSSLFGKDILLKKMLREQKLIKDETLYVGDEDRDVEASKKAGLKSVAVTWGFNSRKLLIASKPDYIINKPPELLKIFS